MRIIFAILLLLLSGCLSSDLRPTVINLSNTIREARLRDYENGRVTFSKDKVLQRRVMITRIERFLDAENNAAVALGNEKIYPDVKKEAEKRVNAIEGK